MAEDEDNSKSGAGGSKSKFKSKWSRVFREKEENEGHPHHTNSFKLNDDVADFLKPSTDKAAVTTGPGPTVTRPKIDVAIAQRWPDAHSVRQKGGAQTPSSAIREVAGDGGRKPPRKPGLTVAFVTMGPDVMGEGGEECTDPVTEISRQRAMVSRSLSDPRRSAHREPGGPPIPPVHAQRPGAASNGNEADLVPQPMRRRAQTSHNEFSPPVQRRVASPPIMQQPPNQSSIDKFGTGLGSDEEHPTLTLTTPAISMSSEDGTQGPPYGTGASNVASSGSGLGAGGLSPLTSLAARRRGMRSDEGMALRRASAMVMQADGDEGDGPRDFGSGIEPRAQHYDALARPDAPSLMPEVPESRSSPVPRTSPASPEERSPFADPKYIKQHPRELAAPPQPTEAPQSLRQQRPDYQPSYMRSVQQQPAQQPPAQQPPSRQMSIRQPLVHQSPAQEQPSQQLQPKRPPPPQVQPPQRTEADSISMQRNEPQQGYRRAPPPPRVQPPSSVEAPEQVIPNDEQRSYTRVVPPSNLEFETGRPPQAQPISTQSSRTINVPSNSSRNQSRSPMRDRLLDENAAHDNTRPVYHRPSSSASSLNHFTVSPRGAMHSSSPSRDENSQTTLQIQPAGLGYDQTSLSRFASYGNSPSNQSPQSSTLEKPDAPQYGRRPSPGDYYGVAGQPLKSQTNTLRTEDLQRRGSEGSNRSFPRTANHSSGPRPSLVESAQAQEIAVRPPSFDLADTSQRPPADYSFPPKAPPLQPAKSPMNSLKQEDAQKPGSPASSNKSPISPLPFAESNPAADAAFADFAARVAHMRGVFKLTAEKEQPSDRCSPFAWLRTGLWWYLRGKTGLEGLLQQRPRNPDVPPRELLAQPHVDLAKTWWILHDPLGPFDSPDEVASQSISADANADAALRTSVTMLKSSLKALSLSMGRNQLMPPHQSLIQGQDTNIWVEYPRFTADAMAVLGGTVNNKSFIADTPKQSISPIDALPLGDTRDVFCYGRFVAEVYISTEEADTDRVRLPCILSVLRGKQDYLNTIVIASQNELVNVKVGPRHGNEKGLTWSDVSWKATSAGMAIRLPHNFDLAVKLQDRDLRSLWNLVEHSRTVEKSLRTDTDESLVYEARLAELQYADSSGSSAFPQDKIRGCTALVFERSASHNEGGGPRKMHRGYRLLLVTDTKHKSLSTASHDICRKEPLFFEFITDSAANGMAAMVIRTREENKQCRILLVFSDMKSRQSFYDVLSGSTVRPDEGVVAKMPLTGMNVEAASQADGFTQSGHPALQALQWQRLGVTNATAGDNHFHSPTTTLSESLRIVALHATGCITDRLNMGKGELLIRLPCVATPTVQMLREPQEDMSMSIDTRHSQSHVPNGMAEVLQTVLTQPTIRTFTFASHEDLHAFQMAVTGFSVRYDGLASNFGISRRRMVVPIFKKWEASNVRLQIVVYGGGGVTQLLAFMDDFSHADAMCFQVKSTDVFEAAKGDGKGKKWSVKLVDAKFSLPRPTSAKGEVVDPQERARRRFVNLDGLDYAAEHDDITVGFDSEEDRDRFANALPAATTVGRMLTLKRRI